MHPPHVLHLIGRAELRDHLGAPVPLSTRKVILLLAKLALEPGRSHERRELAATVWEGVPEDAARKSLRNALSILRKVLPIDSNAESVSLTPGLVTVPLDAPPDASQSDFMPGFDNDWAIEHRLRLRSLRVSEAIADARATQDPARALARAERACHIDPLHEEAAALRARLLRKIGRPNDAGIIETAFRTRAVRELGVLPDLDPRLGRVAKAEDEHPLLAAAKWMLAQNPDEACDLLASTQTQWLTTSVDCALDIHQRALSVNVRPTKARNSVAASAQLFATISGRSPVNLTEVEMFYREALANGEGPVASRLAESLAYANLSRGRFAEANRFANELLLVSRRFRESVVPATAELAAGIIERHIGNSKSSRRRMEKAYDLSGKNGGFTSAISYRINYASSLLDSGKCDRVVELIDDARRDLEAKGGERNRPWLAILEAELHERLGNDVAAQKVLENVRGTASNAGQAAVAMADDMLLRVYARLGEIDRAADALARASTYRRRLGTVASTYESEQMAPTVRYLRDRLSRSDFKAAFDRATKESRSSVTHA